MKNTKKILGVLLAVVMAFSALSMVAYAAIAVTNNPVEQADAVNVKLEVVQVASATDNVNGETYDAVDNDIYAVVIYAKTPATYALQTIRTCVKYDSAKFLPMMSYDGADLLCGVDYYDETGEKGSQFVQYGAQFSDNRFFDADGNVVTKASQATVIGLGKTAAGTMKKSCEYVSDDSVFWSDDYGVMFCEILGQLKPKGAYINTIDGKQTSDWVQLMTMYFQRQVAEDQVYGSEFGIVMSEVGAKDNDDVLAATGGAGGYNSSYALSSATMNYVSNAVEAPVKALVALTAAEGAKSQQIQFFLADGATKTYTADDIDKVDYRFVAQFSTSAFPIDYNADGTVNDTDIDEVGFTMARAGEATEAQLKAFDAAGIAALSKDDGTIRKCWTAKISTDMAGDAAFAFSCRIKGIAVAGGTVASEYIVVPYLVANGQVYYGQAMTSGAQARFNAYADTFLAKKNAA